MLPCTVMPEAFEGDSNASKFVYLLGELLGSHSPLSVRLVSSREQVMHEPICSLERSQHHTSAWKSVSLWKSFGLYILFQNNTNRRSKSCRKLLEDFPELLWYSILLDVGWILYISIVPLKVKTVTKNHYWTNSTNSTISGDFYFYIATNSWPVVILCSREEKISNICQ